MEFYHVLNRGVDKRDIFLDDEDRLRFIHDLYEFNDTANSYSVGYFAKSLDVGRPKKRELLVHIHCFCLMSNHYHLLVSPAVENGVSLFMKKLNGGYAKYFNEKYSRTGALFQGKYKSIHIEHESHFWYIPFYVHFNPLDLVMPEWRDGRVKNIKKAEQYLADYKWSSHIDYLGGNNFPSVITSQYFLKDFFNGTKHYIQETKDRLRNSSELDDVYFE